MPVTPGGIRFEDVDHLGGAFEVEGLLQHEAFAVLQRCAGAVVAVERVEPVDA
jgi:hypothetical protein